MKHRMKRALALLLCLVLLGTLAPAFTAQAEEIRIIPAEESEGDIVLVGENAAAKPVVTTQPKSVTAAVDTTAKFTVKATGAETYQWYWRKSASGTWSKSTLSGSTTATLSVKATAARDGYQYRCKLSNDYGSVYTEPAALTVQTKPVITAQPASVGAAQDSTVKFSVKATGAEAYQWYWRKSASGTWSKSTLSGCTTATLSVKATAARDGYQYRCRVSNAAGYVYSGAAALTVQSLVPVITAQPAAAAAVINTTAQFTVAAEGAAAYQWYYRSGASGSWAKTTLSGCTTATLSVKATAARDGYQYRCKVSNDYGSVYTEPAALTVIGSLPVITAQPADAAAVINTTAQFTVTAEGATAYQWYYRSGASGSWAKTTLSGCTTATLSV
ncbi:MAG: immunoglobulin domain-containing protein, partial [Oscillospiraceae bacterium]|nr:immunoglobulin domain-containing protein [Oscillospiraceae bacterium]